jgi:inner membrane protein
VGVAFLWGLLTHPLLDFFTTWMGNSCLAFWCAPGVQQHLCDWQCTRFQGCVIWAMCLKKESSRRHGCLGGIITGNSYFNLLKWITSINLRKRWMIRYPIFTNFRDRRSTLSWWNSQCSEWCPPRTDYSFFDSQPLNIEKFSKPFCRACLWIGCCEKKLTLGAWKI